MRLKVSTSNFYVGNKQPEKDAHFLASKNCDISGIQEGHSGNAVAIRHALKKTHHTYWGDSKDASKAFAMLDVPVVFPKSLDVTKTWARQISARAQSENIGMPRAATAVRFNKGGKTVTFINTHTNAAVQNRNTKQPLSKSIKRVAEYIAGMVVLDRMIKKAKKRGDLVVLVGDLNYRTGGGVWKFSPEALFKRNNLRFKVKGLDYIGYSKVFKASNLTEIPTTATGSDHPWLTLELNVI